MWGRAVPTPTLSAALAVAVFRSNVLACTRIGWYFTTDMLTEYLKAAPSSGGSWSPPSDGWLRRSLRRRARRIDAALIWPRARFRILMGVTLAPIFWQKCCVRPASPETSGKPSDPAGVSQMSGHLRGIAHQFPNHLYSYPAGGS